MSDFEPKAMILVEKFLTARAAFGPVACGSLVLGVDLVQELLIPDAEGRMPDPQLFGDLDDRLVDGS